MSGDIVKTLADFYQAFDESTKAAKIAVFEAAKERFYNIIDESSLPEESKEVYLSGTSIRMDVGDAVIIEIASGEAALKALENGSGPYSIKDKMLNNGKGVKISKAGHRYKVIGMDKSPNKSNPGTEKGKATQADIRKILETIKPTLKAASKKGNGEYVTVESFKDSGLLRTQTYKSKIDYQRKRPARSTNIVMFRVMSEKPGTSAWVHPGFKGKKLLGQLQEWLEASGADVFEAVFKDLMKEFT
jgi:hypothetical protein